METSNDGHRPCKEVPFPKKATMEIIKERLPAGVHVAKDVQDLLRDCSVEFINMLTYEANGLGKGLITPKHVLSALETLGFEEYDGEVRAAYEKHEAEKLKRKEDKAAKKQAREEAMTDEEATALQLRLFAEARARMSRFMDGVPAPATHSDHDDANKEEEKEEKEKEREEKEKEVTDSMMQKEKKKKKPHILTLQTEELEKEAKKKKKPHILTLQTEEEEEKEAKKKNKPPTLMMQKKKNKKKK